MKSKSPILVFVGSALVFLTILNGSPGTSAERQRPRAYQSSSLKGLSNEDLFAYMGGAPGATTREREERNREAVPERFWDSSPRDAALALLAATQAPEGKEHYAVAIGVPPAEPPSAGMLVFSNYSDRSYNDMRTHYFVLFNPKSSFFAYAMTLAPGQVGYDVTRVGKAYELRSCELPYAEARHLAQVIWWLGLAETKEKKEIVSRPGLSFSGFSTADGRGHLSLLPEDGGRVIDETGILRAMTAGTWAGEYDREVFLNVAGYAVEEILFERLFKEGREVRIRRIGRYLGISRDSGEYAPDELIRLKAEVLHFLSRYSPDGRRISHWHVLAAAQAAGDLVVTEAAALLGGIQKNLPRPAPAGKGGRTLEEIGKEIRKLMTEEASDESEEKVDKLMEEFERVQGQAMGGQAIEKELNSAATTALRKIKAGDDVAALKKWAESGDHESTWAASRLRKIAATASVEVLAARLDTARPGDKPEILYAIYRADPQKALDIAAGVPASEVSELSTAAAEILGKAGLLSGDKARIASLIKVVMDEKANWEQRNAAIDVLVPRADPGRYPDKALDDALIAVVETEPSQGLMPDFTQPAAARALSWRKRIDKLESLVALFEAGNLRKAGKAPGDEAALKIVVQDPINRDTYLSAVTYLARLSGEAGPRRLARMIAPHFKRTNLRITEILWSAWAADLREFKDDIERIATASPTDEEGHRASSFGGPLTEVNERYHLARKIAALWNEEDLLTRGKLLIALGFKEAYELMESAALERRESMKEALMKSAREATPTDLEALRKFMIWAEDKAIATESESVYRERKEAFAQLARGILDIQVARADGLQGAGIRGSTYGRPNDPGPGYWARTGVEIAPSSPARSRRPSGS